MTKEQYGYCGLFACPENKEEYQRAYLDMVGRIEAKDFQGLMVASQMCINYLAKEVADGEVEHRDKG